MSGENVNGGDVKMTGKEKKLDDLIKEAIAKASLIDSKTVRELFDEFRDESELYGWHIDIIPRGKPKKIYCLSKREVSNSSTVKPSNRSTQRQEEVVKVGGTKRRKGEVARQD